MRIFDFLFYHLCRSTTIIACRYYFGSEIAGLENVPEKGPFILAAAGHRSYLDIFLVSALTPRKLRYVGKAALWEHRVIGWLLTRLGGFPIGRSGGKVLSMRTCLDILASGSPLVIFPEGTRRSGPEVGPLFDGATYLAIRAGVPIIPVGIWGAEAIMGRGAIFPKPRRLDMIVGPPIEPPVPESRIRIPRDMTEQLTQELHRILQELLSKARIRGQPEKVVARSGKATERLKN